MKFAVAESNPAATVIPVIIAAAALHLAANQRARTDSNSRSDGCATSTSRCTADCGTGQPTKNRALPRSALRMRLNQRNGDK